ncbi:hypothetical protein SDRG_16734 [Saprolegnia diclina VS20]|uniref:Cyclin-like domain-containing protein n=1 Tax=Saprolegnia diclina (strain VS20) TaxID=1156394 RepID=T0R7D8_SAPDV|nr:hypothetical protein SDRG_16734 [Saprolegnia diclina VS20]EQC25407.1 hypothetical protein SDRG_16734 [Saprolegnia diclina VS20]|eukprot:XP_008621174.1 hypothetical protein SDRG_16734 [Saprolegnia diclina VS20]
MAYTFTCTNDWLLTDDELKSSPSSRKGIAWDQEVELRKNGIIFFESLAKIFRIPRLADSTGKQLFHRFFTRESFTDHDKYLVAATCLFLGAKAEDHPLAIANFAEHYIAQRRSVTLEFALRYHTIESISEAILAKEYVVLHALGFDLDVAFPHMLLNDKIERLVELHTALTADMKAVLSNTLLKTTWSFLNDCSRTPLCLRLDADDIAAGAVYLAGMLDNTVPDSVTTSDSQPWECVLRTNQDMLIDAATFILEAYVCDGIDESKLSPCIVELLNRFHPYRGLEEVEFNTDDQTSPLSFAGMDDGDNATDLESDVVNGGTPDDIADKAFEDEQYFYLGTSKKRRLSMDDDDDDMDASPSYTPYSPPYGCGAPVVAPFSPLASSKRPKL